MSKKSKVVVLVFLFVLVISVVQVNAQGQFVGSKNSSVYHFPSCHYVDNILPENKIWFSDVQDALNHGYRACKVCNPPSSPTIPETKGSEIIAPISPVAPTQDIISVYVTNVIDGDTFDTLDGYTIRLADIDAPEIGETGYLQATEYLESLIEGKTVTLDIDSLTGTDPYGRYVCLAYIQYNSTHCININQALIEQNYAIIDNYTNNEFEPTTWTLYTQTQTIPEYTNPTTILILLAIGSTIILLKKKK